MGENHGNLPKSPKKSPKNSPKCPPKFQARNERTREAKFGSPVVRAKGEYVLATGDQNFLSYEEEYLTVEDETCDPDKWEEADEADVSMPLAQVLTEALKNVSLSTAQSLINAWEAKDQLHVALQQDVESAHSEEILSDWFNRGKLPCGFSSQPIWPDLLESLQNLEQGLLDEQDEFRRQKSKAKDARDASRILRCQIKKFAKIADQNDIRANHHTEKAKKMEASLRRRMTLDIHFLIQLAEHAVFLERKLTMELEATTIYNPQLLEALISEDPNQKDNHQKLPKLSLLLSCLGAEANTIQVLATTPSHELIHEPSDNVSENLKGLPRPQQIVVLYAKEMLSKGTFPYSEHDCLACQCDTPEKISKALAKKFFVEANSIRKAGITGRGALLFLKPEDFGFTGVDAEDFAIYLKEKFVTAHRTALKKEKK